MKKFVLLCLFAVVSTINNAQKYKKVPESKFTVPQANAHLQFLASDALLGRKTGEQGNLIAARYIAEQFRKFGVKPVNGGSYFQEVPFERTAPSSLGTISTDADTLQVGKDFIVMSGGGIGLANNEVVHVGYGWVDEAKDYDDYKSIDVKDKVVIAQVGTPDSKTPQEVFSAMAAKRKFASERGAAAFIEIYNLQIPWKTVMNFFGKQSLRLKETEVKNGDILHLWVNAEPGKTLARNKITELNLNVGQKESQSIISQNVVGIIEGTDPTLKSEYIVLTAHFDHIGHGSQSGRVTPEDSIFNGARDNAFGTTAVLTAAEAFSHKPTKRSILLIAYTGEEIGLLGSKYYSEHPLVPLNKCVFNLNCDGAGYDTKEQVSVIGLGRTSAKGNIIKAAEALGLTATDDPAPEQNLFDRSDNVNLAKMGIPSPNYAPGMTSFSEEIYKYYHQVTDNPENIDPEYLLKYCQSYTYAARLIANDKNQPTWVSGDKYEKAYDELYGK
jgi:hypothetical protein